MTGGTPDAAAGSPAATEADRRWLRQAVELASRCPASSTAFSVGAVVVSAAREVLGTGFSRERDPHDHAEEVALDRAGFDSGRLQRDPEQRARLPRAPLRCARPEDAAPGKSASAERGRPSTAGLAGATIYSSLEPCGSRASRPVPCAELIVAAGLCRVVIAWLEPPLLAAGGGADLLRAAGLTVIEVPELADAAKALNAHLLR
ncbi:MAG TPA: dCMP deaminase [Streptosporangiaceae bacterium]